jgi:hypothetical protein
VKSMANTLVKHDIEDALVGLKIYPEIRGVVDQQIQVSFRLFLPRLIDELGERSGVDIRYRMLAITYVLSMMSGKQDVGRRMQSELVIACGIKSVRRFFGDVKHLPQSP